MTTPTYRVSNANIQCPYLKTTKDAELEGDVNIAGILTTSDVNINGATTSISGNLIVDGTTTAQSIYMPLYSGYLNPRISYTRINPVQGVNDNGYIVVPQWATKITVFAQDYAWSSATQPILQCAWMQSGVARFWGTSGVSTQTGSTVSSVIAVNGFFTYNSAIASVTAHHMMATLYYTGRDSFTRPYWHVDGHASIPQVPNSVHFNGYFLGGTGSDPTSSGTLQRIYYYDANTTGGTLTAMFE